MEFGKISDVSGVKWELPGEDPRNALLSSGQAGTKIYLGSPAWANKHWKGKIYPEDCDQRKFLYYYSRNFTCIELNTTHYRVPTTETVKEWRSEVPSEFLFCPKIPKTISHSPLGLLDGELLKQWTNFLEQLGENSGPSFIQFHELFSYSNKHGLFKFLESWPEEFELTLELRHSSWFHENKILPALGDYLRKKKIGLVITDVAGRRDVLHMSLTSDWTMIRIVGNDLHPSDEKRLHDWAKKITEWRQNGPRRIYFFLHQPDDNWTIEFSRMASGIFQKNGFVSLPHFAQVSAEDLFSSTSF